MIDSEVEKAAEYITSESQEVTLGESPNWTGKIFKAFPAFAHRNYQLYFSGQLVSLIGTWLQTVGQGWLVFKLTNSAFLVGLVTALGALPIMAFALLGGVVADRFDKRKVLIFTQSASMMLAFTLGFLDILGIIKVWEIAVLAFLLGTVNAIDTPTRQAFVVEMVGRRSLPSAIAMGAGTYNAARAIGPGFAGFLIAVIGVGATFILNGISFIGVIIALFKIKAKSIRANVHPNPVVAIKSGVSYAFSHPKIRLILVFCSITSVFGWSYTTIMPVVAKNVFGFGPAGLGLLYSSSGLGALVGSIAISIFSTKVNPKFFIFGGNFLAMSTLILFTFTSNIYLALIILFFSGFGLLCQFATMNSSIQHMVDDGFRGRVLSMYTLAFLGMSPIGSFQIGYVAQRLGVEFAIRYGAVVSLVFGLFFAYNFRKISS